MQKGHCQPTKHEFPLKLFEKELRRFNPSWFKEFPDWLEYSINKNVAFFLYCYFFKPCNREQAGGDSFVATGFTNSKGKKKDCKFISEVLIVLKMKLDEDLKL